MLHIILEKAVGKMKSEGYYYIDFDKTLAHHETDWEVKRLGKPIPEMLNRVKGLIRRGENVKIFTARAINSVSKNQVKDWLVKYGLPRLEVTNVKGQDIIEIWDDRAKAVMPNKGKFK